VRHPPFEQDGRRGAGDRAPDDDDVVGACGWGTRFRHKSIISWIEPAISWT